MEKDIYNFPEQLLFSPEIKNKEKWKRHERYVLAGMGGSRLQGDILKTLLPDFPLSLYSDYGLPEGFFPETGLITASYSGNTEEVLDTYNKAVAEDIPTIAISKGGNLLAVAKEKKLPYIELPQNETQPRIGVGYSLKALLKATEEGGLEEETKKAAENMEKKKESFRQQGEKISSFLENKLPVVYASRKNGSIAKIWKINFNEAPKIPSFYNVLPELNHNEMTGFDTTPSTGHLSEKITFVFLTDSEDHPKNKKRMEVLRKTLEKRGFEVLEVEIEGDSGVEKIFSSFLVSAWTAYRLSKTYSVDPEKVPMVEEFKRMV